MPLGEVEWALEATVIRDDLVAAVNGEGGYSEYIRCLGLAAGYPVGMCVRQVENDESGATTFYIDIRLAMLGSYGYVRERGVLMRVQARCGGEGGWKMMTCFLGAGWWTGFDDMLGVAWEAAVSHDGPFFPNDEMRVEARFKVLADQGQRGGLSRSGETGMGGK